MAKIIRITESDLHMMVRRALNEIYEGTQPQNDYLRGLCQRRGIEYDDKYDQLSISDASMLIDRLKNMRLKRGEQPPSIDQLLNSFKQQDNRPKNPSFMDYEEVTPDIVNAFWNTERYSGGLVPIDGIRPEFRPAYEIAKKNTAMLAYAMSPSYTVYFNKSGDLFIQVNTGASWSLQNHLAHYAGKCSNYFKLYTAAYSLMDDNEWELLYKRK